MKCISKGWCHSISNYRRTRPRSSNSTFVCQYKFQDEQKNQVLFLNVKEQVGGDIGVLETIETHSFGYSTNSNIQFVGSSNGLILCKSCNNCEAGIAVVPYVCNPILNQWVSVSPICVEHKQSIFMGLAFDGVSKHHFKLVICYASFVNLYRKRLIGWMYSSNTGEWREVKAKLVKSSILKTFDGDISYLYRKGMVHWISNEYMLVYHFENNFFKVIELPAFSIQRMWESEGCLYYAAARTGGGFSIWKSVDDNQFVDENATVKWQCKHVIEFPSLLPRFHVISAHKSREALKDTYIELLGFDEDLQILYLALPQTILSYSFETRKVSSCTQLCENMWVSAWFSMQPSGVNLPPLGDDFNVSYRKSRENLHVFGLLE